MFYSNCAKTPLGTHLRLSTFTRTLCSLLNAKMMVILIHSLSYAQQCWNRASVTYLRTGCASLLRGTGIPPAEGALGLGKPLLIVVVPAGLVRVVLLILLGGFAGTVFWTTGGPGEEVVCVSCVVSWLPEEPEPWLLNAFTGCRRAKGDGAAGERNLPGESTAEWERKTNVRNKYK